MNFFFLSSYEELLKKMWDSALIKKKDDKYTNKKGRVCAERTKYCG
jgi:hypothetical protein